MLMHPSVSWRVGDLKMFQIADFFCLYVQKFRENFHFSTLSLFIGFSPFPLDLPLVYSSYFKILFSLIRQMIILRRHPFQWQLEKIVLVHSHNSQPTVKSNLFWAYSRKECTVSHTSNFE